MKYHSGNIESITIAKMEQARAWQYPDSVAFTDLAKCHLTLDVITDDGEEFKCIVYINANDCKHQLVEDVNRMSSFKMIRSIEKMKDRLEEEYNSDELKAFARSILSEDEFVAPF